MQTFFEFGEQVDGYEVRVLNERAVRAAAGIVFFLAMIAFMNAWLTGNFRLTQLFVVAFLADFTIRIFINPRFSPSMIVGQWFVRKQQPEYVGAPQKRFAWAIGFLLALAMFYLVVLNNVIGPVNLIVCALCLTLLFFETAFGICLGCWLYNLFNRQAAQLCPGGVCETPAVSGVGGSWTHGFVVLGFAGFVFSASHWLPGNTTPQTAPDTAQQSPIDAAEAKRCEVPEFAKAMGHEAMWKLHNHCQ